MNPQRRQLLLALAAASLAGPGAPAHAQALRPRPLAFPRDHGSHPETRTEWWYLTGHAEDSRGRLFGFQVTFFRSRVDGAQALQSRLAARQLVFAHAAITDVAQGKLWHDQRLARWNGDPPARPEAASAVFASPQDTDLALRGWHLRREADGRYRTRIEGGPLWLDLAAVPTQAIVLQGDAGFSRKGPDPSQASFYTSQPQLAVHGSLGVDGERLTLRQGTAWLDHEWSEALMHPDAVGWDWIGMNLFNGDSLTAFRLRRRDGSALWAGGSRRSAAQAHDPAGGQRFGPGEVVFEPRRHWTSPVTGARYPVEWTLHTPAGTHTLRALADAQELDSRASTGTVYWEGLSELLDSQGQAIGRGYLELTGYAQKLVLN